MPLVPGQVSHVRALEVFVRRRWHHSVQSSISSPVAPENTQAPGAVLCCGYFLCNAKFYIAAVVPVSTGRFFSD